MSVGAISDGAITSDICELDPLLNTTELTTDACSSCSGTMGVVLLYRGENVGNVDDASDARSSVECLSAEEAIRQPSDSVGDREFKMERAGRRVTTRRRESA